MTELPISSFHRRPEYTGNTGEFHGNGKSEEFLLTAVDQIQESLQLYRYADGMEYRYYYGTGTRFMTNTETGHL